jgi:hypothetical protein
MLLYDCPWISSHFWVMRLGRLHSSSVISINLQSMYREILPLPTMRTVLFAVAIVAIYVLATPTMADHRSSSHIYKGLEVGCTTIIMHLSLVWFFICTGYFSPVQMRTLTHPEEGPFVPGDSKPRYKCLSICTRSSLHPLQGIQTLICTGWREAQTQMWCHLYRG